MFRFLASATLYLLGNAIGLIVASLVLSGFRITASGFLLSLVFFTLAEIVLGPFIIKVSLQYVPALRGGIALVTTFVVLLLTTIFTDAVSIVGVSSWFLAPLIIWGSTLLAGIILPLFLFKKTMAAAKDKKQSE